MEHQFQMSDSLSKLKKADKPNEFYRELRCDSCRFLICYEYVLKGYIKFTCPRCGEITVFTFKDWRKNAKNPDINVE